MCCVAQTWVIAPPLHGLSTEEAIKRCFDDAQPIFIENGWLAEPRETVQDALVCAATQLFCYSMNTCLDLHTRDWKAKKEGVRSWLETLLKAMEIHTFPYRLMRANFKDNSSSPHTRRPKTLSADKKGCKLLEQLQGISELKENHVKEMRDELKESEESLTQMDPTYVFANIGAPLAWLLQNAPDKGCVVLQELYTMYSSIFPEATAMASQPKDRDPAHLALEILKFFATSHIPRVEQTVLDEFLSSLPFEDFPCDLDLDFLKELDCLSALAPEDEHSRSSTVNVNPDDAAASGAGAESPRPLKRRQVLPAA